MSTPSGTLLLVIPPVVRSSDGKLEVDEDFSNNIKAYLHHFESVVFACPVFPQGQGQGVIARSIPLDSLPSSVEFIQLPSTYREDKHWTNLRATRGLLRELIRHADYLLFSPHAKYDWPTEAVREAIKLGRRYDIECDLDWTSLYQFQIDQMKWGPRKLRKMYWKRSFERDLHRGIQRSALTLLQGKEVFEAYKDVAANPHMVLNVQVSADDYIEEDELSEKLKWLGDRPLRITYAGQMIDRKGPIDWVRALIAAAEGGVSFTATWYGDGPLRDEIRHHIDRSEIRDRFSLPGLLDRATLMCGLRATDIFLFCHKTAESPRCLVEALASGCALVGYRSAYPEGLVASHGGGVFADMDDWEGLAGLLTEMNADRTLLAGRVRAAADSGRMFDRESALTHRAGLIREYLGPNPVQGPIR